MTKAEWYIVTKYINTFRRREELALHYLNEQNYGLAKRVFYEKIEPLIVKIDD